MASISKTSAKSADKRDQARMSATRASLKPRYHLVSRKLSSQLKRRAHSVAAWRAVRA
jgi:hypothetical protein